MSTGVVEPQLMLIVWQARKKKELKPTLAIVNSTFSQQTDFDDISVASTPIAAR